MTSLRTAVVAVSLFLAALVAVPAGATPAAACTKILAENGLVGIDDNGRVVTESGVVRSPDGSTVRLTGANDLAFEKFGYGRVIGHAPRSSQALTVVGSFGTAGARWQPTSWICLP